MKTIRIISTALIASSIVAAPASATPPSGIGVVGVVNGHFGQLDGRFQRRRRAEVKSQ